ncbi:MAG: DNA repair protein RadC [Alistipes sp.]|nr:DNA repair protein RadC [Alistipes sp.]
MKRLLDKLRARGLQSLSDAELLAAIMGDGDGEQADEIAGRVLAETGGLAAIADMELSRLRMSGGMGYMRAVRLAAAVELGRRMNAAAGLRRLSISTETDAERLFRPQLENLKHEECWVLYLSSANEIIERTLISRGGVQATVVDYRLIVKRALELLSTRMILVHNHPSGTAAPSEQDRVLTERVAAAAALFDIELLDHLIISRTECFGFRRAGLLGKK